jgi:hypothetical protein
VQEYERKQLLERIGREGSTLGVDIPERIEIQGEEIRLREFVFEIKRRETVPPGERDRVERAKRNLRRERLERKELIEAGEIDFEAGERVAGVIIGIDRALEALETLGSESVAREAERSETADTKRWMDFLKKALGQDDGPEVRGR